jgi:hypothetical protein
LNTGAEKQGARWKECGMKAPFTHANPKSQKGFKQPKVSKGKGPQYGPKRQQLLSISNRKTAAELKALLNK